MNAICLNNLSIRYGNRCILHNISHCFAAAQWHLILGRSGMGKSTLLHAIADLLPHNADISGSITTAAGDALQGKIAYMAKKTSYSAHDCKAKPKTIRVPPPYLPPADWKNMPPPNRANSRADKSNVPPSPAP